MDVEKKHHHHHDFRSMFDRKDPQYTEIDSHKFKNEYLLPDKRFEFSEIAKSEKRHVFPIRSRHMGKEYMAKVIKINHKTKDRDLKKHLIPMMVHHKNVIKIHEAYIVKEDKIIDKKFIVLIMELCPQNLEQYLTQIHSTGRTEDSMQMRFHIINQLLEVFSYLHERNIVHLDIKPENILLTDKGEVKITDFGEYVEYDEKGFDQMHTGAKIKHKIKHIFKKEVRHEEVNSIFFYKRKDVYNLGVVLLLLDQYPKVKFSDDFLNFEDLKFDEKRILGIVNNDVQDPMLRKILPDMLQEKPKNRLNLSQIWQEWRNNDTSKKGKIDKFFDDHLHHKNRHQYQQPRFENYSQNPEVQPNQPFNQDQQFNQNQQLNPNQQQNYPPGYVA